MDCISDGTEFCYHLHLHGHTTCSQRFQTSFAPWIARTLCSHSHRECRSHHDSRVVLPYHRLGSINNGVCCAVACCKTVRFPLAFSRSSLAFALGRGRGRRPAGPGRAELRGRAQDQAAICEGELGGLSDCLRAGLDEQGQRRGTRSGSSGSSARTKMQVLEKAKFRLGNTGLRRPARRRGTARR